MAFEAHYFYSCLFLLQNSVPDELSNTLYETVLNGVSRVGRYWRKNVTINASVNKGVQFNFGYVQNRHDELVFFLLNPVRGNGLSCGIVSYRYCVQSWQPANIQDISV